MSIRIEFNKIAYILTIGESINSKQIYKISFIKEFINEEGQTYYADLIWKFGTLKRYKEFRRAANSN